MVSNKLNDDLNKTNLWAKKWYVTIKSSKTKCMTFSTKHDKPHHADLVLDNSKIDEVSRHTHLGVTLSHDLSWRPHLLEVYEKACKKLTLLKGLKFKVNRNTLSLLYKSLIRPVMEYADVLWDGCYEKES